MATRYRPMDAQQVAATLSNTEKAAAGGTYELFKTSAHLDSTAKHPEWLGGETKLVEELGQEA